MKIRANPQACRADARKIIRTIPDILDKSKTITLIYERRLTIAFDTFDRMQSLKI